MAGEAQTLVLKSSPPLGKFESTGVSDPVNSFLAKMREVGLSPTPLTVKEKAPGLSRGWIRGVNGLFLRYITWPRKRQLRVFGKCILSWEGQGSGWFRKMALEAVKMPIEAELRSATVKNLPEVEETAVFAELRRDPILAVKVAGQWFEVYRWL